MSAARKSVKAFRKNNSVVQLAGAFSFVVGDDIGTTEASPVYYSGKGLLDHLVPPLGSFIHAPKTSFKKPIVEGKGALSGAGLV